MQNVLIGSNADRGLISGLYSFFHCHFSIAYTEFLYLLIFLFTFIFIFSV